MALSQTHIGLIVAGCAGAVLITIMLILYLIRGLVCVTFSPRPNKPSITRSRSQSKDLEAQHPPSPISLVSIPLSPLPPPAISIPTTDSTFTAYGHLIVPPGRRATDMAISVINHVLIIPGLCPSAKVNTGTGVPMLPVLRLPLPESESPEEQVKAVMCRVEAGVDAEGIDIADCRTGVSEETEEDVFVVGEDQDGEEEPVGVEKGVEEIGLAVSTLVAKHKSLEWGSGKGMTQLYVIEEV
ncbi:hypothetical protein P3342_005779 [Pyrenophora teres f. teres]|uniref:Uncharacterized protein n=2 Tax=Pyrenophora teres f. teres TaxID=97479 RepID=E3RRS9_PYRTT|nr:hypothetical protein PTT_11546 [Pyrenophora teres f. teres 0-1]KAE8845772.1 hypothetical protein HRS9139_00339 [Pyrenophora teres f. teres]KAE8847911.1 hypothetical protein PTNB85_01754 [Pyrenophora teres f. teres]KAE8853929.1 hypothetical protein HRS9122_00921 [Pyrenophora teres f. teres]KAE8867837.1 hypothetical protein PTNB29_01748 [Pyrenophora teres f. teres]